MLQTIGQDAVRFVHRRRRGKALAATMGRGWLDQTIYRYADEIEDYESVYKSTYLRPPRGITLARDAHRKAAREVRRAMAWWILPLAEILIRLLWVWLKTRWEDRNQ